MIAREALRLLPSQMVAARLFDRQYELDWSRGNKKGETIQIRRRPRATVTSFTPGTPVVPESITETGISLTIEEHFDCTREVTAHQQTLSLEDYSDQVIAPAILALAEQVDTYALSKLKDIPNPSLLSVYNHDASAGGPILDAAIASLVIPNSPATLAQHRAVLNKLRVPMSPRFGIVSPEGDATMLGGSEWTKVNEAGSDGALREAELGVLLGIATFMAQNVDSATHTPGTQLDGQLDADFAAGSVTLTYDNGTTAAGTIKEGDRVKIHGYGWVTCAALSTAVGGAGTFTIKEPLREAVADDTFFSVLSGTTGANTFQQHGAFFHPGCIAFVAPPLAAPMQADIGAVATDPYSGLSIRVVTKYDQYLKTNVISLDLLVGAKMVDGRLGAAILLGV